MESPALTIVEIQRLALPPEQIEFIVNMVTRVEGCTVHQEDGELFFHGVALKNPVDP